MQGMESRQRGLRIVPPSTMSSAVTNLCLAKGREMEKKWRKEDKDDDKSWCEPHSKNHLSNNLMENQSMCRKLKGAKKIMSCR